MALSTKAKKRLEVAMARRTEALEVIAAIDAGANAKAASVAAIGTTTNLVAPAVIADAAPLVGTENRLDAIEAKVDAILAALKAAGLMNTV